MDFLGMPDVSPHVFLGLTAASLVTSFLGISTGAAGGLLLLALMASVLPPAVLLPIHTVVQLGSGITRTLMMWRHVMRGTLPPFIVGAVIGAAAGAKIFVALPINILEGILGLFIIVATWLPRLGRIGGERTRFIVLGFGTTFLGMFVSATGTLLAPLIAGTAPNRYGQVATFGALISITHVAKLVAFGFLGFAIGRYVPLMAAMIATGAVGNWLGERALDRMGEQHFRLVFRTILTLLGLRLIWVAIAEWYGAS
jgi:uncharacterized membrane protein YfcA